MATLKVLFNLIFLINQDDGWRGSAGKQPGTKIETLGSIHRETNWRRNKMHYLIMWRAIDVKVKDNGDNIFKA